MRRPRSAIASGPLLQPLSAEQIVILFRKLDRWLTAGWLMVARCSSSGSAKVLNRRTLPMPATRSGDVVSSFGATGEAELLSHALGHLHGRIRGLSCLPLGVPAVSLRVRPGRSRQR
jgi:hypothetical protein